jgi:hypothetical protein
MVEFTIWLFQTKLKFWQSFKSLGRIFGNVDPSLHRCNYVRADRGSRASRPAASNSNKNPVFDFWTGAVTISVAAYSHGFMILQRFFDADCITGTFLLVKHEIESQKWRLISLGYEVLPYSPE